MQTSSTIPSKATFAATIFTDLLELKRPAHTAGERAAQSILERALNAIGKSYTVDTAHNIIVDTRNGTSSVLFSSHYDSAHRTLPADAKDLTNKVRYTDTHAHGVDACIGADDASGIYVMIRMLQSNIPALYIFHAAEEVGCIGSRHIANKTPHLLDGITHAIAFDRRGTTDVIYEQGGQSCASAGCAGVIAYFLNEIQPSFQYAPSDAGVLTDTKMYRSIVPECFNISVGYDSEHTAQESQDLVHLERLADACCVLPWHTLPVWRDPHAVSYYDRYDSWSTPSAVRYGNWEDTKPCTTITGSNTYDHWSDYDLPADWLTYINEDFDSAMDAALNCLPNDMVWMADTVWDADEDDYETAVLQMVEYLDRHHPLTTQSTQGTQSWT